MKYPEHRNRPVSTYLMRAVVSWVSAAVAISFLALSIMSGALWAEVVSAIGATVALANAATLPFATAKFMEGTSEEELTENERGARKTVKTIVLIFGFVSLIVLAADVASLMSPEEGGARPATRTERPSASDVPMMS
jgi:hypothetical protein